VADPGPSPFRYHLELTPAQLKEVHDALRAFVAGPGADERTRGIVAEVLAMLPDEEHIAQIRPGDDGGTVSDDAGATDDDAGPGPPDIHD
jgi:hypothetical protein